MVHALKLAVVLTFMGKYFIVPFSTMKTTNFVLLEIARYMGTVQPSFHRVCVVPSPQVGRLCSRQTSSRGEHWPPDAEEDGVGGGGVRVTAAGATGASQRWRGQGQDGQI